MVDKEVIINDLNVAKLALYNRQMLTPEMFVRIGQAITSAIDLLREDEVENDSDNNNEQTSRVLL